MKNKTKKALRASLRYHVEEFAIPPLSYALYYIADGEISQFYNSTILFFIYILPFITVFRIINTTLNKLQDHETSDDGDSDG